MTRASVPDAAGEAAALEPGGRRILVADDDPVSRRILAELVARGGHEPLLAKSGEEAWTVLDAADAPRVALLDWVMPDLDGPELCRRLRASGRPYVYVILVTSKGDKDEVAAGLDAGADDYLTKPVAPPELHARIRVGRRLLALKRSLDEKIRALEEAITRIETLEGMIPICMHCKRIRADDSSWTMIETYIERHSRAMFTHALCEQCLQQHYPPGDDP